MQIQCPACETAYEVPDQIKAGRSVQCAACGVKWAPVPAVAPAPAPSPRAAPIVMAPALDAAATTPGLVASPQPEARLLATDEASLPQARRLPSWLQRFGAGRSLTLRSLTWRSLALAAAWVVSVALVIGLGTMAVLQRGAVMQAWPPSTRLFAALGLH